MKVLLLSCNTGEGHNSAARALKEQLEEYHITCDFVDALGLANKKISKKITDLYVASTAGNPTVFKMMYKAGELYSKIKIKSPVYGMNKLCKKSLTKFINDGNYDVIIATHLFPAETLTAMKKTNPNLHFLAVATDYVSIPFWEETNPDYFIIPHQELVSDFQKKGIAKEKLLPMGIPVSLKFNKHIDKKQARLELDLPTKGDVILIMSGSMGFGNLELTIQKLLIKFDNKVTLVVLCGNNTKIRNTLKEKFNQNNVHLKDFTTEVSKYMDASDVILTKPGGLTSTETAVKHIPTILTTPIPGCETYNAKFFEKHGLALVDSDIDAIVNKTHLLINDKKLTKSMINNQKKVINAKAARDICDFIIENYNK
ncbi:MAG: glycosyltransferase [Bacilli bacterium]